MNAKWNIWLLNKGEKPLCWMADLYEKEAKLWCIRAADKVFDGSDADAFMLLRSDMHPDEVSCM